MRALQAFRAVIDGIYGVYLDATNGFALGLRQINDLQMQALNKMPGMTLAKLDEASYIYGEGDPNFPEARALHTCTQAEIKHRNARSGPNYVVIGNLCVVQLYQYWEDQFRNEIALELGMKRDDLKSDLIGDVRLIRNAIVHHRGIARDEIDKCKTLRWFSPGDPVVITERRFDEIVLGLKGALNEFERRGATT